VKIAGGLQPVADEIGCTKSFLSLVLRGKRRIGLDIAMAIERKYDIPASAWENVEVVKDTDEGAE
jgi:antitoxin component HigA of HigAB toxin-antitoxin module